MKRCETREKLKRSYIIAGALSLIGCFVMVFFPVIALDAAKRGISLWAGSVLPALFPFFICADFMIALGIPMLLSPYFQVITKGIFKVSGVAGFIFFMSVTSGYPVGAKLIGDFVRRGEIKREEGLRMLSFCSTSGPLFMLGSVGLCMLGSVASGTAIAIAHYGGALLNGVLFCRVLHQKSFPVESCKAYSFIGPGKRENLLTLFTESIFSACKTLGLIGGYLVLFTLITDFLQFSGFFNLFSLQWSKGILRGLFEMTLGCLSISETYDISETMKWVFCSFLISFGGFSVMAQSLSVLSDLQISPCYYLKVKFAHGLLSGIIAFFIAPYFLQRESATVGMFGASSVTVQLGGAYHLFFSLKMIIIILLILFFLIMISEWLGDKEKKE